VATDFDVKERVRQRDGYACAECGMTNAAHLERWGKSLEVHRIQPGSEYTDEGCVTLCKTCHGPKPRRPWGSVPKNYRTLTLDAEAADVIRALAEAGDRPFRWELEAALRHWATLTPEERRKAAGGD
jgi:hypothetical protein